MLRGYLRNWQRQHYKDLECPTLNDNQKVDYWLFINNIFNLLYFYGQFSGKVLYQEVFKLIQKSEKTLGNSQLTLSLDPVFQLISIIDISAAQLVGRNAQSPPVAPKPRDGSPQVFGGFFGGQALGSRHSQFSLSCISFDSLVSVRYCCQPRTQWG